MTALEPLSDATLWRMLRFALHAGAERVHLRPGHPPLLVGPGDARPVRFRQLAVDDTAAAASHLLARSRLAAHRAREGARGATQLPLLVELPGQALFDARISRDRAGLAIAIDVLRPLHGPVDLELLEV
jgi:hypothetical protein